MYMAYTTNPHLPRLRAEAVKPLELINAYCVIVMVNESARRYDNASNNGVAGDNV